jgi:hypothetical protein
MKEFDALIQEMAKGGKMVRLNATRREIEAIRRGMRKPKHPTSTRRLMQPKEEPKVRVLNATRGTPMVNGKHQAGQKIEPWNK